VWPGGRHSRRLSRCSDVNQRLPPRCDTPTPPACRSITTLSRSYATCRPGGWSQKTTPKAWALASDDTTKLEHSQNPIRPISPSARSTGAGFGAQRLGPSNPATRRCGRVCRGLANPVAERFTLSEAGGRGASIIVVKTLVGHHGQQPDETPRQRMSLFGTERPIRRSRSGYDAVRLNLCPISSPWTRPSYCVLTHKPRDARIGTAGYEHNPDNGTQRSWPLDCRGRHRADRRDRHRPARPQRWWRKRRRRLLGRCAGSAGSDLVAGPAFALRSRFRARVRAGVAAGAAARRPARRDPFSTSQSSVVEVVP
jgi:hypothetical protein